MRSATYIPLLVLAATLMLLSGCATKVTRIDVGEVRDLSGRWNDTDSQLVAEAMIQDCLNRPWLGEFSTRHGRRPDLIVGQVVNVRTRDFDLFQQATVQPVVDFNRLQIVLIIVNFEPVDISPLIPLP